MTPPSRMNRGASTQRDVRVSVELGASGRLANALLEAAACVGIAKRRGVLPAFQSSWIYREFFSFPDEWFVDDLTGTIPASALARALPPAMRPYLQDLRLWSNVVPEIRAAFKPSPSAQTILDKRWSTLDHYGEHACAVHVRRGDTLTRNKPDTIQPLSVQYFTDAVANWQPSRVFVFSDDPQWCGENLPSDWIITDSEPGPEDYESDYATRPRRDWIDMLTIARIVGNGGSAAISNSSYSLLGAWLGASDRVAYPQRWFGKALLAKGFDSSLIIPQSWTKIPTE